MGMVVGVSFSLAACGGDDTADPVDASTDAPRLDAGRGPSDASDDSETSDDADVSDSGQMDTTPPTKITDLAATTESHTAVKLTWTAPSDEGGSSSAAALYELRHANAPITTLAEFLAATSVAAPVPTAAGSEQTTTVAGLEPNTQYHFAIRARDAAGNFADVSNSVSATTKARAVLLITEVAVSNNEATGYDFVELVAKEGGSAEGIEIKELNAVVYKLGAIDLVQGDRIVVHTTGATLPDGHAQEDVTKSKTSSTAAFASTDAFDVYSTRAGITATDSVISVTDGTTVVDALAFSNRDGDAAAATMTAFANLVTANAWTFGVNPADGVNDCDAQRAAVNVSTSAAVDFACGRIATSYGAGISLNRNGLADTNTKADFYVAPQTMGHDNAPVPQPNVVSVIPSSATSVVVTFDQEIAPLGVTPAAFSVEGLTVSAASLSHVHQATLTTTTQVDGGYDLVVAASVTNLQGAPLATATGRFCGHTAEPALLAFNEVSPNIGSSADLIELLVTRGGGLAGYQVRLNPTSAGAAGTGLATLPAICAAAGDLVVVHLSPPAGNGPESETLAKDQFDAATYAANYDAAWDVLGANTGITFTNSILAVRNAANEYIDAVALSQGAQPTQTALDALTFIQSLGLWLPADCGGVPCTAESTPTAQQVSASMSGVGTTPAGNSVRRIGTIPEAASWAVGPSSFGAPNITPDP